MPFYQPDSVRYYRFPLLEDAGVTHAVISRRGGVSPEPWLSLNVGGTVGDAPENVQENRRRTFAALGKSLDSLFDVWQVHSKDIVFAERPRPPEQPHQRADAILTDRPGVTLFMRFADCVPILLYDPHRRAVGLVHAGWQGTVSHVVGEALRAMQERYGSRPAEILAGIGPSIGPHHYEVGPDVVEQVQASFGEDAGGLLLPGGESRQNGHRCLDLWSANRLLLERAGVRRIEIAGICTACEMDDWYSHRGEKGRTGRFGALIAL